MSTWLLEPPHFWKPYQKSILYNSLAKARQYRGRLEFYQESPSRQRDCHIESCVLRLWAVTPHRPWAGDGEILFLKWRLYYTKRAVCVFREADGKQTQPDGGSRVTKPARQSRGMVCMQLTGDTDHKPSIKPMFHLQAEVSSSRCLEPLPGMTLITTITCFEYTV